MTVFLMKKSFNNQEIITRRLCLRQFRNEDFDTYATIMADSEIGKWFPKGDGFSRKETEKSLNSIREHWNRHNFGIWAILHKRKKILIGRCGLNLIDETSEVEIDFLLAKKLKKSPKDIAKKILDEINSEIIESASQIKGFINLRIKKEAWLEELIKSITPDYGN